MEVKISSLRIGARIYIGHFEGRPISWLKASKDSDLISEYALFRSKLTNDPSMVLRALPADYMSNAQNIDHEAVFRQTELYELLNGYDANYQISALMEGFMNSFEEYETCRIREITLMSKNDLNTFSLFKKHARRVQSILGPLYVSYHLSTLYIRWPNMYHYIITENGSWNSSNHRSTSWVRPLCRIDPETLVVPSDRGFVISESGSGLGSSLSDSELTSFLGISGIL